MSTRLGPSSAFRLSVGQKAACGSVPSRWLPPGPTKEEIANEVVKKLPPPQRQHDYEKEIPEKLKTKDKVTAEKKEKLAHEPNKSTRTVSKKAYPEQVIRPARRVD